jgi:hypothetical protein
MSQQLTPTATALPLNGRCGAPFGRQTCKGSRFGNCCSNQFYCGSTPGERLYNHCYK